VKTLYIYLDESGNFDFSKNKGTKHFVLCAMTTFSPVTTQEPLQVLKYQMLEAGTDIEYFHASEDTQAVRNQVFENINNMEGIRFHYIYAEKNKAHPTIQNPRSFYALFGKTLLKYCFNGKVADDIDQIVVIFDKVLPKKDRGAIEGSIKPELKKIGKPFRIYFHQTMSDFNGQIADYAAWSLYVQLERDEKRPFSELKAFKPTVFDIFNKGTKKYY